jgi:type II secretory pathway component HofQ
MAKRKDPKELSPAYRKRLESYERRNPGASRSAAAGKAKKAPEPRPEPSRRERPAPEPKASRTPKAPKEPSGKRRTKDPSEWTPAYRKRIENFLRKNPDASLEEARGHKIGAPNDEENPSDLEWAIWSQRRKLGNLSVLEALGQVDSATAEKGRQILKAMIKETTIMFEQTPAGTTGYYDAQDKLKALYKRLEALGLVARSGDIMKGDVGYH